MTRNQIEARKNIISKSVFNRTATEEEKREYKELSCREMINSCLAYGDDFYRKINKWNCKLQKHTISSYADDYIEELGEELVKRLYSEQSYDFSQATLLKNVYRDSEGLSYNLIKWADEQ